MIESAKTLIILTPAFTASDEDHWLPSQAAFVKCLNRLHPELKIIIIAFHFPKNRGREYIWNGNRVIAFGAGMRGKWSSLLLWTKVWRELKKITSSQRVIGIFSFFCSESAFIGHHFALRYGLNHKIWIFGQDALANNDQVRRIRPTSDELIAISDFLENTFESNHGIRPHHIIPIGLDPNQYPLCPVERDIDLIGVGSLSPLKHYSIFVEIVKELRNSYPHIKAVIVGDGNELIALKNQMASYGLEETIQFKGAIPPYEVLQIMQRSRILLHPSSYEGFGMVCLEALYAGTEVISFCRPMKSPIENWHIAESKEEMLGFCQKILKQEPTKHSGQLPFNMEDTVRDVLKLFGIGPDSVQ